MEIAMRWILISIVGGLAAIFLAPIVAEAAVKVRNRLREEGPPPELIEPTEGDEQIGLEEEGDK